MLRIETVALSYNKSGASRPLLRGCHPPLNCRSELLPKPRPFLLVIQDSRSYHFLHMFGMRVDLKKFLCEVFMHEGLISRNFCVLFLSVISPWWQLVLHSLAK